MKIERIDVFQVDLPYAGGVYRLSGKRGYRSFDATVVCVGADNGLQGWGESTPFGSTYIAAHARGVPAGIAEMAPHLIGMDPRRGPGGHAKTCCGQPRPGLPGALRKDRR